VLHLIAGQQIHPQKYASSQKPELPSAGQLVTGDGLSPNAVGRAS
jgi:hypothetical protein